MPIDSGPFEFPVLLHSASWSTTEATTVDMILAHRINTRFRSHVQPLFSRRGCTRFTVVLATRSYLIAYIYSCTVAPTVFCRSSTWHRLCRIRLPVPILLWRRKNSTTPLVQCSWAPMHRSCTCFVSVSYTPLIESYYVSRIQPVRCSIAPDVSILCYIRG